MRRIPLARILATVLVFVLLEALPQAAWAQQGKLSGRVTQAETSDPVPGANVVLMETQNGAAANADGYYSVLNIAPGAYTVRVSAVGFTTRVIEEVRVTSDRTTPLDIALGEAVVEGEELVVEAVAPVVDANQTTSRSTVTSEEIDALPATSLKDITDRTANSYEGFVRGSRRFETKTIVEGVDVSDAYYALSGSGESGFSYGGARYGNTARADKTNNSLFNLNPSAVQEVAINSGAKPVQYSSASGGVVTVSLREGRGPIRGTFSARVAPQINRPGPDSLGFYYDAQRYFAERDTLLARGRNGDEAAARKAALYTWTEDKYDYAEDPEVDLRGSLGGAITDRWRFFFSGQWFQTNGYRPNEFSKRVSGQLKTSIDLSDRTELTALGIVEDRGLWGNWNNRDYQEYWRFYLEGVAQNDGGSYLGSLKLTQLVGDNAFLNVQYYRTFQRTRYGYVDDDDDGFTEQGEDGAFLDFRDPAVIGKYIGVSDVSDKMFYRQVGDPFSSTGIQTIGVFGGNYKTARPVPYAEDAISVNNGFKVDFSSQVTPNHYIQTGSELKLRRFTYDEVYGIDGLGYTLNEGEEPYVPRSYERHPWELSFYGSDRMEYGGLIVNLGLRADVVNRDMEKIADEFSPFRRDTVAVAGRPLARNFFERGASVPIDVFFNPSVGVSHPIGNRGAMYFSYARSEQLVPYNRLYSLYEGNHSRNRFFTYQDPEQDPIVSNNYELGVQWEFIEGWGADANAYMRSIDNYGSVLLIAADRAPEGGVNFGLGQYRYATSFGYADVRGIELVLRRRPLGLTPDVSLGLTASYTYSSVERANEVGANQTNFQADGTGDTQLPFENAEDFKNYAQEVRGGTSTINAGYNRRHRGVLRLVSQLPFETNVGLSGSIESGFLYPRVIGSDPRDRDLLTGPLNYQIDLRLQKKFTFTERFGLDLFLDVTNLTNHKNVIAFDGSNARFQEQGIPTSRLILPDGSAAYGPARNVHFGTQVRF